MRYIGSIFGDNNFRHGGYGAADTADLNEKTLISKRPDVKVTARYHVLNFRGNDGYTLSDKNAIIAGCDETWATKMFVDSIVEGYFPKTATEAMLTENTKNQLNLQIGDTIHH